MFGLARMLHSVSVHHECYSWGKNWLMPKLSCTYWMVWIIRKSDSSVCSGMQVVA